LRDVGRDATRMALRRIPTAPRDFDPAYVRFGSGAETLKTSK